MWQSFGHSHPAGLASTGSPLLPGLLCCGQEGWVCLKLMSLVYSFQ